MAFPRFFAPVLTARLFDPMPLPRRVRVEKNSSRASPQRVLMATKVFSRQVKKVPMYS